MKLYNFQLSPFASRVRISIYRKGLNNIEIVPPPEGGLKSQTYLELNPMGRVPTLVLDSGQAVPESAAIIEYLEDAFPTPSLRPSRAEDLARARLFLRLPDIYFENAPRILMSMRNPADRDEEVISMSMAALHRGLSYINYYVDPAPWAVGGQASIADSALIPIINVVSRLSKVYDMSDLISRYPRLNSYWEQAQTEPIHARVIAEQLAAVPID